MFAVRRSAVPARNCLRQAQRRLGSSSHGHGHGEHHHHAEPVNVNLKPGLFIGLLSVPAVVGIYNWANSDPTQKPLITRLIEKYSANIEELERRNAIHTLAAERAAFDRHLFFSCKSDMNIELSCPEIFNVGGSVNVPAGHYSDLTDVVAHYEKRAKIVEEDRVSRMKDGKVQSIYDHGF